MNLAGRARIFARKWILRCAFWAFSPLPVRHRVVFASNSSSRLRGNLLALGNHLRAHHPTVSVILHLGKTEKGFSGQLRTLCRAVKAEYLLATSSVFIVDDYYFPLYVTPHKRETTVIQTWHACGAFKKIGYSVLDKSFGATPSLVKQVDIHSNYDHCLVASKAALPHYMEAFGLPAERFISVGIPSTDALFSKAKQQKAERDLRDRLSLPTDRQVILYAPTFRGNTAGAAKYADYLDINIMREALSDRYILLLKLHPFVARKITISSQNRGFAFDVSSHSINTLMWMSDLLVTDYSSVIFEYSLLSKPMIFLAPDAATYQQERGFYFDYEAGVPGPVFTTTEDVASFINEGAHDVEQVESFAREMFDVADGHASDRVIDRLVLPNL